MILDRPKILHPLFSPTSSLPGIGKRLENLLQKKIGSNVIDLLFHMPISTIDRSLTESLKDIQKNSVVTLKININKHSPPFYRSKKPYKILTFMKDIPIEIIFFNAKSEYIKNKFPEGMNFIVSGKIDFYKNNFQIINPDHLIPLDAKKELLTIEPVYPLFSNLNSKVMLKAISSALNLIPKKMPEWIPENVKKNEKFPSFIDSLISIHKPKNKNDILPSSIYRKRLAYDEIYANQLEFYINRHKENHTITSNKKFIFTSSNILISRLKFKLTEDQEKVINEITYDQKSSSKMKRMLQGDVGSGKTIIAILAILNNFDMKGQSALMAPTEILAKQHFNTITKFLNGFNLDIELLTSKIDNKKQLEIYKRIKNGEIHLIIGTQSLISKLLTFKNLKLAIIDEQHKFGVHQRNNLQSKGKDIDILMLSATPIPRSLSMTKYGDLDISIIRQKPENRMPIETIAIPNNRFQEILSAIERALNTGEKVYWICPLIDNTENDDIQAAEKRFSELSKMYKQFNPIINHGKLDDVQKNSSMEKFLSGESRLLVTTSIIEVGVDIPDATIIIIENAERFGLAQLHQLRGRVGRGKKKSYCLLLYKNPLNIIAKKRLETIRNTNDGFFIAEEDLKLRGPGELFGKRQSGDIDFKIASLAENQKYIFSIKKEIKNFKFNNINFLLNLFNKNHLIDESSKKEFNLTF